MTELILGDCIDMKKKISLNNRYGINVWLEPSELNEGWYSIMSDEPVTFQLTLKRQEDDSDKIIAVDPTGGPMIALGENKDSNGDLFVVEDINEDLDLKLKQ